MQHADAGDLQLLHKQPTGHPTLKAGIWQASNMQPWGLQQVARGRSSLRGREPRCVTPYGQWRHRLRIEGIILDPEAWQHDADT